MFIKSTSAAEKCSLVVLSAHKIVQSVPMPFRSLLKGMDEREVFKMAAIFQDH